MLKLYVMNADDKGEIQVFESDTLYVGRGPDSDIEMKDKFVSRRHLKISKKKNRYFIEDLGSKNGTFVDGQQIKPGVEIEVKDEAAINIGMSVLCLGDSCKEGVMDFVDSIYLSGDLGEDSGAVVQDRPMTAKKNMELICNVSEALKESKNITETLEKIINYILLLLKRIDRGVIILVDTETGKFSEVLSIPRKGVDLNPMMLSRTIVERVLKEGEPFMIADTQAEVHPGLPESVELMDIRSVMCVPLISRATVRGVIYVDSIGKPHGFRNEDFELLSALSGPAAVAIENATLHTTLENLRITRPRNS